MISPVIHYISNALNVSSIFISKWDTRLVSTGSTALDTIKLPTIPTGYYLFGIDWGDGTFDNGIATWDDPLLTHQYLTPGIYTITIYGDCEGWQFANTGDRLKLLSILQWGGLKLGSVGDYFWGCENLDLSYVSDVLNLTNTTSFYRAFYQCTSLTKINNINKWDTTFIFSLNRMFERCINFDDNIGAWNTVNVIDMQNVFASASKFNNGGSISIGEWDTKNVTTFRYMFGSDSFTGYMVFNQYIGDWNTSSCTDMSYMFFRNPKFNQDIGTKKVVKTGVPYLAWDTKNVTTMLSMFSSNGIVIPGGEFNNNNSPTIGNWNTTSVTDMRYMFNTQVNFNQPIGTNEINFSGFPTYLGWDTQNVTSFYAMFYAHPSIKGVFNNGGSSRIGNWNTSKATTMAAMFLNQPSFNQSIGCSTSYKA
jgi:hypothetical protein